ISSVLRRAPAVRIRYAILRALISWGRGSAWCRESPRIVRVGGVSFNSHPGVSWPQDTQRRNIRSCSKCSSVSWPCSPQYICRNRSITRPPSPSTFGSPAVDRRSSSNEACLSAPPAACSAWQQPVQRRQSINAVPAIRGIGLPTFPEDAPEDEERVGGALAQTAHEIRKPFAAEGNVNAHPITGPHEH